MPRFVLLLALLCLGATAPPKPQPWPVERFAVWPRAQQAGTIAAPGLTAQVRQVRCGELRPISEGCDTSGRYLRVTVTAPGTGSIAFDGHPSVASYIGIGRFGPGGRPALILISDMGGSGGCATFDMVVPEGTSYRALRLHRSGQPSNVEFCAVAMPQLPWPRDADRDGRPELILGDDRFACRFASCAGSWIPPRIFAIVDEQAIDVSRRGAFAPLFRAQLAETRRGCEQNRAEAQGACAAYAADATRLGVSAQAWAVIRAQVRRGCRGLLENGICPDIYRIPATFPRGLAAFLKANGYD